MSIFAENQKPSVRLMPAFPKASNRAFFQQNHAMPPDMHLQRMLGNQGIQDLQERTTRAASPSEALNALASPQFQSTASTSNIIQRQEVETGGAETAPGLDLIGLEGVGLPVVRPEGSPCQGDQLHTINTIRGVAQTWREAALTWLSDFQSHVRRYAPHTEGRYARIGRIVYRDLQMLDAHFGIRGPLWRNRRQRWPMSETDSFSVESFEEFANSINPIRRAFSGLSLVSLAPYCSDTCPENGEGADRLGSAHAGSNTYTLFFGCFADNIAEERFTGVVLHEAFHATYSDFNHDTYSFQSHYPGRDALSNADSYATFAAYVALGKDYRRFIRASEALEIIGEVPEASPAETETTLGETPSE